MYLYEPESNQQSMVWKHSTSLTANTLTTIDLLGFGCFEHLSYSPDCTQIDVAVLAEVRFYRGKRFTDIAGNRLGRTINSCYI